MDETLPNFLTFSFVGNCLVFFLYYEMPFKLVWCDDNILIFFLENFKDPVQINPSAIFANNETSLSEIDIYGFDYDYTLACYKSELHFLIYKLGREALIQKYGVWFSWDFHFHDIDIVLYFVVSK